MAAPILYRSSDASAPVLTGTAGDLVNLLDKCLVTGYGAVAAAGWTRNTGFAGNSATRAVFRQGAGNQFYLDIDDRGATGVLTGASGKEAAVRMYEAMTDVSTGTNPFPTTAQVAANTANFRKSVTADTLARGWFLIADDRTFILGILDGDIASTYKLYYCGDLYSIKSGDGYRTCITVRNIVNSAAANGSLFNSFSANLGTVLVGLYCARIAAGTGTSSTASGTGVLGTASNVDTTGTWPTLDGNIYLSRILVGDATAASYLRGWLRGVYMLFQGIGMNDGDTFTGTGDFAGRSFIIGKGTAAGVSASFVLETTAWDTSS